MLRRRGRLAFEVTVLMGLCFAEHPVQALTMQELTVNNLKVYRYTWTDSNGLSRSVSLKKEGEGNPGHGGFAVQMIYKYKSGADTKTVVVNPSTAGDGFGYFVSHERYRTFKDGTQAPIANKIFQKDDSPLGRNFPVQARSVALTASKGIMQFRLTYPRYGTVAATKIDPNTGEDSPPLATTASLYKLYNLKIAITWYFQDGKDYPRIINRIDMSDVPGPDRVSFDVRGPYGKMNFDAGTNPIKTVMWGDRYHFRTTSAPLTRNATWVWNAKNARGRYNALIAGTAEFGLVEPKSFANSAINDGYADGRGKTSASYNGGNGCPFQPQKIPCDYEWAYQSAQYELPYDNANGTTTSEKIAWGSTPYFGTSQESTYDGTTSEPFVGFPANKVITYQTCLVFGQSTPSGLARDVANAAGTYNCSDTASQ